MYSYSLIYYYNGTKDTSLESQVISYVEGKLTELGITHKIDLNKEVGEMHMFGWDINHFLSDEQHNEIISHIHTSISSNINSY